MKMSNYETKHFMAAAKVMMVRFKKFSVISLIADGFYFPDKRMYRLLPIFICVSFVKEHDRVSNLDPTDGCFCN